MVKSFTKAEDDAVPEDMAEAMAYMNFGKFVSGVAEDVPWSFVTSVSEPNTMELDKTSTHITYEFMYRIRVEVPRDE